MEKKKKTNIAHYVDIQILKKNLFKKSLLHISNEDIKLQTLSNILSYKLIDYTSSCPECYKNFGIIIYACSSRLHDFVFPEFLSVIFEFTDLNVHSIGDYQILKKNLNYIRTLYSNNLELPQIGLNYYLKAIIYMDWPMHFTITLGKLDHGFKELEKDVSYYHDGRKNGGFIIPIEGNEETLITESRIPYIMVFKKL